MINKGPESAKPEEVAAYIAGLTAEMAQLARRNKLMALGYLLDLARLEARERAEEQGSGNQS